MTSLRLAFNVTVCNLGPGAPGRLGVFNYEYMMFEWAVREGDSRVEGLLDVKPTQDVDLLDMLGKGGHYSLEVEFSLLDEDGFEVGARAARELLLVSAHVPRAAPDSACASPTPNFVLDASGARPLPRAAPYHGAAAAAAAAAASLLARAALVLPFLLAAQALLPEASARHGPRGVSS